MLTRIKSWRHGTLFLGIFAGLFAVWLITKAMRPLVRSACIYVLQEDRSEKRQTRSAPVEVEILKKGTMTRRVTSIGKLRANASVRIKSEMNGRVKELGFTEGASVKKDDVLIRFDDADVAAELKQAEAELTLRKSDYERTNKLYEQKAGSSKEFDKAKAEYKVAEGRYEAAKARLDKTVIKAPFEGVMGLTDISVGAYAQTAQEIVTLVDTSPIKIEFKIPEKHIHAIGVGQTAEIRIDAMSGRIFHATVEAIDATVDLESHSIAVRASVSNEDGLLRPGLFANVSLIIGEKGETLMVDEAALDREGEIEFVWVVEKGKAGRRRVLTGVKENGRVEIVAGLKPDTVVVIAGQLKLSEGMRTKIVKPGEAGPSRKEELASEGSGGA